jgi:hypothetical protein
VSQAALKGMPKGQEPTVKPPKPDLPWHRCWLCPGKPVRTLPAGSDPAKESYRHYMDTHYVPPC